MKRPILEESTNIFEGVSCSRFIAFINELEVYCDELEERLNETSHNPGSTASNQKGFNGKGRKLPQVIDPEYERERQQILAEYLGKEKDSVIDERS